MRQEISDLILILSAFAEKEGNPKENEIIAYFEPQLIGVDSYADMLKRLEAIRVIKLDQLEPSERKKIGQMLNSVLIEIRATATFEQHQKETAIPHLAISTPWEEKSAKRMLREFSVCTEKLKRSGDNDATKK